MHSVIQDDFSERLLTGEYAVHHIFTGVGRRKLCEKYGFVVAVRPALHAEIHAHPASGYDAELRERCYHYWLEHIGTAEEFRKSFGATRWS